MRHGALRLSAIALGSAVVALLTPVAPATAEIRQHGSHGFAGPAVHGHGFHSRGPAFHHGFAGAAAHRPAMRVVHGGGHRYVVSGGRAYAHARRNGYAYGHRAYGHRYVYGYAYRHYGGGYYAGGYSYPYHAGGYYHHRHRYYYAGGYYYRHRHGCWWYRHFDPYDTPSWCYGPAYGYSYGYIAPVYEYSYEPSHGYAYGGVYGGSWRGRHPVYSWNGGWHGGRGHTTPLVGAGHINGAPHGFAVAHGGPRFSGHMHGHFMH